MDQFSGGNRSMIPNVQSHGNFGTPTNQNHPFHHQQQTLASRFNLYPLVEKLTEAIETGTRDQNSDALVSELSSYFDKCQQLLNSTSGSKTMSIDGEKRKLEQNEQLLQQRRDLMVEYKKYVEDLVKIESY